MTCPLCGQHMVDDGWIRIDLSTNTAIVCGEMLVLQPRHAELLAVLVEVYPRAASDEFLKQRMYGYEGGPESTNIIGVFVHHLRQALRKTGVGVETVQVRRFRLYKRPIPKVLSDRLVLSNWTVPLSPIESRFLDVLVERMYQTVCLDDIRLAVWGDLSMNRVSIWQHVKRIRAKIAGTGLELEAVYGKGLRLQYNDSGRKPGYVEQLLDSKRWAA